MATLALLAAHAADLERLVGDLTEEVCVRWPSPDAWSFREHVAHFYDAQETLDARIGRMLADDAPDLAVLNRFELAE